MFVRKEMNNCFLLKFERVNGSASFYINNISALRYSTIFSPLEPVYVLCLAIIRDKKTHIFLLLSKQSSGIRD